MRRLQKLFFSARPPHTSRCSTRGKLVLAIVSLLTFPALAESPHDLVVTGHVDEAIEALRQQILSHPKDAEAQNLLCRSYFQIEQWDAAISACEKAVSLDPKNSMYDLWLGRAYGEKADRAGFMKAAGLAGKVRDSFERAVRLDTSNWEARTDLAEFYLEAPAMVGGGKDKALAQADALMKLKPPLALWVQGRVAEKNKDSAGAEREFRAAIASSGGGAHSRLNLALFYLHTKHFDEMEEALHAMETSPLDRPESLTDGASILLRTGRSLPFAERLARKYIDGQTVEEEPSFKAHTLLGDILEKQGDKKAAAEEYRKALALAHEYNRAQAGLKRVGG
jgi:tetratricopeptide (TPR) repeat protein